MMPRVDSTCTPPLESESFSWVQRTPVVIRVLVVEPSVVGWAFHGSTSVLISMLIACDIHVFCFGSGITLWVFVSGK